MGRVTGKVAFITGAARGQGRAHAVRLAEEGADIIAVDIARKVEDVPAAAATPEDLAETAALVEKQGRRIHVAKVDVRDQTALNHAVAEGVDALGRLDIVVANAGFLAAPGKVWELPEELWQTTIDVNLTGTFHTVKAAVPHMISAGNGGSVVLVSSTAGLKGVPDYSGYAAAKHGLVGLARSLAGELGPYGIRANSLHPGTVDTPMVINETTFKALSPDQENPGKDDVVAGFAATNLLPVPWLDARDIANAVLWLVSDEARYVTGVAMPVDAGMAAK